MSLMPTIHNQSPLIAKNTKDVTYHFCLKSDFYLALDITKVSKNLIKHLTLKNIDSNWLILLPQI
jgi:hypothetical protein